MRRRSAAWSLAALLAVPAALLAHGGHQHVMGTVTKADTETLEVKTKDGAVVTVSLTPDTKYLRGKEAAAAADLQEGMRVVVDTRKDGARTVAVEVKLGVVKAPK
jgi:hypothetical protein